MKPLSSNKTNDLNVVSLFSGCGGLDLGFAQAGFQIIWANDCGAEGNSFAGRDVWQTYQHNHPDT